MEEGKERIGERNGGMFNRTHHKPVWNSQTFFFSGNLHESSPSE